MWSPSHCTAIAGVGVGNERPQCFHKTQSRRRPLPPVMTCSIYSICVTFLWVNARLMQIKHSSVFIDWKVKGRSISQLSHSRVSLSVIVKLRRFVSSSIGYSGGELRVAAAKKWC